MLRLSLAASLLFTTTALADVPRVTTDISPVHGLVSMVMGDLGSPDLLVEPGASPHGYALRPSQAAALQQADAVFWIGHDLAPWLDGPLDALASGARVVELLDIEGTVTLAFREEAVFAPHDHDDHDAHDEHDDDHDDDHSADEEDDHGHAHGGVDPHAWLDPVNASVWLSAIAETLAALDPDNAAIYQANAETAQAEIAAVRDEVSARIAPLAERPFVVFHDAFQYFERSFALTNAGAISMSDASRPSAARIAEIRQAVADRGVVCVFSEPQFNPGLVETVANGAALQAGVIDPLGTSIELGQGFYPALLHSITEAVEACLSES